MRLAPALHHVRKTTHHGFHGILTNTIPLYEKLKSPGKTLKAPTKVHGEKVQPLVLPCSVQFKSLYINDVKWLYRLLYVVVGCGQKQTGNVEPRALFHCPLSWQSALVPHGTRTPKVFVDRQDPVQLGVLKWSMGMWEWSGDGDRMLQTFTDLGSQWPCPAESTRWPHLRTFSK